MPITEPILTPEAWVTWMYGASFYDGGKCFEKGAIELTEVGSGRISRTTSVREDGIQTTYEKADGDPLMFWRGCESNTGRVKRFESARWAQRAIVKMNKGFDFDGLDLCTAVQYWLGRAYYSTSDELELFFAVDSSAMLDAVAAHYHLPVPCNQAQRDTLDTNPELYRARHYDLLGLGEGNYLNVVVGSVSFAQGRPSRLLLYTFMRQWEFAEQIILPEFSV